MAFLTTTSLRASLPMLPVLVAAAAMLVACGSDGDSAPLTLSPAGEAGRSVAQDRGCAACHGTRGQGGVGPAFVDLFGSTVALDDGTSVVADDAYLTESITEPAAKQVEGYSLPMPKSDLSDAEIASIIDYIRELSEPQPAGTAAP